MYPQERRPVVLRERICMTDGRLGGVRQLSQGVSEGRTVRFWCMVWYNVRLYGAEELCDVVGEDTDAMRMSVPAG